MAASQRDVLVPSSLGVKAITRKRRLGHGSEQIFAGRMLHGTGELARAAAQATIQTYEYLFHIPNPFLLSLIAFSSSPAALIGSVSTIK